LGAVQALALACGRGSPNLPAMVAVSIQQVSKSYQRGVPVLDGVTLEIAKGEVFFLLGSSGCGKTTLLRLIAGFLAPDQGRILFDQAPVEHLPPERRGLGMVFQNYALWPHLSVAENVAFGLEVQQVPLAMRRRQVEEALALVELPDYGERRIADLSGGQQQRVALARAIVVKPKVLLLDEPLSNLDARLRTTMRAEIRRVCKSAGLTALYVTHDQSEALSTADRIALLVRGKVAQVGTPRELYETPNSRAVAQFVGEANLVSGVVAHGRVRTAFGTLATLSLPAGSSEDSHITVCLRPERIRILPPGTTTPGVRMENTFEGVIEDGSYQGASAQWRVAAGGNKTPLLVGEATPPARRAGETVTLGIAPGDVVVLPA
jgi:iron(III) transport system ATP-binding protein